MVFRIAETIGCTAAYVLDEMSLSEFAHWGAWFTLKHEAEEKAMKQSRSKRPKRR